MAGDLRERTWVEGAHVACSAAAHSSCASAARWALQGELGCISCSHCTTACGWLKSAADCPSAQAMYMQAAQRRIFSAHENCQFCHDHLSYEFAMTISCVVSE